MCSYHLLIKLKRKCQPSELYYFIDNVKINISVTLNKYQESQKM